MNPYKSPTKIELDKQLITSGLRKFKNSLILHRDGLKQYLDNTEMLINDLDLTNHKPINIFEVLYFLICGSLLVSVIFLFGVANGIENKDFWLNFRDNIKDGIWKAPLNP